jgi:hypothetical protein
MKTALVMIAALAGASSAAADPKNEVSIGSFDRAMHASSANAVTTDSLGGGVLGYARALDVGLSPRLQTWATGGFAWGGADGTMFSTLTTELDTLAFTAGGRARYSVWKHLQVGGRIDIGTARAALTLREGNRELDDSGWGMTASAAAALDLLAWESPGFELGVRLELGYTVTSAVELAPAEANDSSTIQLEMSQASLGHLDLGGKFFALTVLSQF